METVESSIFASLQRRHGELRSFVLSKVALIELCHAIEDEYAARSSGGVVFGTFQRVPHFLASERRWRSLAQGASFAAVLADFDELHEPGIGPIEVPIDRTHPLSREWTLIIDAPGARSCVSALELPSTEERADRARRFEVVWSSDPGVVAEATAAARALLETVAPAVAAAMPVELRAVGAGPTPDEIAFAGDLATRAFVYMAAALDGAIRSG